jgi:hypothetical protein
MAKAQNWSGRSDVAVRQRNSGTFSCEIVPPFFPVNVMTAAQFRRLALSMPQAEEHEHMNHPDFRVAGKIFASLGPAGSDWAMIKVAPDEQRQLLHDEPDVFSAFAGAWGRQGCTRVHLPSAATTMLRPAVRAAWRNIAPQVLVDKRENKSRK